jgi:hypothetical protein
MSDDIAARIAELKAEITTLADRLTRIEAARDMDQQHQRSALDRVAAAAEALVRLEKRK